MPTPPHPKMQGISILQSPTSTNHVPRDLGVIALATREQLANNSPQSLAPTCQVGPQAPVSWHSLPHSGERASECNEAPGTTSGTRYWSPQCNGGHEPEWPTPEIQKRGPMQPVPLTSGGITLEEITCRGWGPHLQYSFLIKFFLFCLWMWRKNRTKKP